MIYLGPTGAALLRLALQQLRVVELQLGLEVVVAGQGGVGVLAVVHSCAVRYSAVSQQVFPILECSVTPLQAGAQLVTDNRTDTRINCPDPEDWRLVLLAQ